MFNETSITAIFSFVRGGNIMKKRRKENEKKIFTPVHPRYKRITRFRKKIKENEVTPAPYIQYIFFKDTPFFGFNGYFPFSDIQITPP